MPRTRSAITRCRAIFWPRAKNRHLNTGDGWAKDMTAHCLIHAGAVLLITNSVFFAMLEFVIHWVTDFAKCEGAIDSNEDQAIHYTSKVVWALFATFASLGL